VLRDQRVKGWTFQRDQGSDEREIATRLRAQVEHSVATIFLISPATLDGGATQWMELAYADAFRVPTFVMLHHISFADLETATKNVPPLVLSGQCSPSTEWRRVIDEIGAIVTERKNHER